MAWVYVILYLQIQESQVLPRPPPSQVNFLYKVLDIGCGSRPHGSVNLDLGLGANSHHKFDYDVKAIPNFTRGALPDLPYRSRAFDCVFCSHTLEHIPEPLKALREIARVSSKYAILIVPNNPVFNEFGEHYFSWSKTSFKKFCGLAFSQVEVRAQTRFFQLEGHWLFKRLFRTAWARKRLPNLLSSIFEVELVALCRDPLC